MYHILSDKSALFLFYHTKFTSSVLFMIPGHDEIPLFYRQEKMDFIS